MNKKVVYLIVMYAGLLIGCGLAAAIPEIFGKWGWSEFLTWAGCSIGIYFGLKFRLWTVKCKGRCLFRKKLLEKFRKNSLKQ